MKQLTTEEAIALHDGGAWRTWTDLQKAAFQLIQNKLCMPFSEFHRAIECALGRPVYTHELALNSVGLQEELAGRREAPSLDEILGLLPSEMVIAVVVDSPSGFDLDQACQLARDRIASTIEASTARHLLEMRVSWTRRRMFQYLKQALVEGKLSIPLRGLL